MTSLSKHLASCKRDSKYQQYKSFLPESVFSVNESDDRVKDPSQGPNPEQGTTITFGKDTQWGKLICAVVLAGVGGYFWYKNKQQKGKNDLLEGRKSKRPRVVHT